ncbi:MAG TPA: methyltransferase domain-containing protein [Eudoraea sp.]|nr:methyltransferase domain-containing protein [Eudoraea sp.]
MDELNQKIENHYLKKGLFEDIVDRLIEQGIDLYNVSRADIAAVDEFHVRGAAVSMELASSIDLREARVLDVGCGLGGPCRMLADEFDCICTGIDLSTEFIRTAAELSKLVKLDNKTSFVHGDALHLPFANYAFDVVWTQHVQMNIPDKDKFYSEIKRVLKPGGYFLYYDIYKKGDDEVIYPMPWAGSADQSFLFTTMEMEQILLGMGLTKIGTKDQTKLGIEYFEAVISSIRESGPPKMGLNVLMGESTMPKLMNLLAHLKDGKITLQSGTFRN